MLHTYIHHAQIGSNQGCDDKFTDMSAFAWRGYDSTDLYFAVTARPATAARLSDHYLCERDHWGRPTVALLHVHPHAVNRAAEDEAAAELLYKLLLHEVCWTCCFLVGSVWMAGVETMDWCCKKFWCTDAMFWWCCTFCKGGFLKTRPLNLT